MKIAQSSLQLESSHFAEQYHARSESLRFWVGTEPGTASRNPPPPTIAPPKIDISDAGKAAQAADATQAVEDASENDPEMRLIRLLIEFLTGRPVQKLDTAALDSTAASVPQQTASDSGDAAPPPRPAGYGVEYDYHEVYSEREQTSFAAQGSVVTADGKKIDFSLQLQMSRSYYEESRVSLRLGDAAVKKDPLVINFAGTAAQLTDQRFSFDLDGDGSSENVHFATGGSGFLAFDRNGNGKIDDGSELFGPSTGQGFKELAVLDDDGNGWIDENDAAWSGLHVLSKDGDGRDRLLTLAEAGVGALSLASVATPFDLKDSSNRLQAQILASGVYLGEDGSVGSLQQLDLTV